MNTNKFSPRKRRCFYLAEKEADKVAVFSAQAEVFPKRRLKCLERKGFLRASGGVSRCKW